MNKEQIKNALEALGLGPDTISVAIWDDRVVWETVESYEDHNEFTPHEARIDD